ncbi:NACHT domain-containing protein [Fibrella aestuarina]|nr:hypothetical protein [Fibrella aestuarina]
MLVQIKSLYQILPKGTVGGKEFAQIIDLLLYQEAKRNNRHITLFSDAAGDYRGLDSYEEDHKDSNKIIGYQYKFYPSPLSNEHRADIKHSLISAIEKNGKELAKWIIITPEDFIESSTRKSGGDVTWFNTLSNAANKVKIEHWGHKQILSLFLQSSSLCMFYYPDLVPDKITLKKTIQEVKARYDRALVVMHSLIEFVGMSVYKHEATRGVPMQHIYIPLELSYEENNQSDDLNLTINPIELIEPGKISVILGSPGSGKSTLQKFLALSGSYKPLQNRYGTKPHKRISILITLRRYANELKTRQNLPIIEYIIEIIKGELSLVDVDLNFIEYYLETGQAILLFDGVDELPDSNYKYIIRDRIKTLITVYPRNTVVITSRFIGYESIFKSTSVEINHYKLVDLRLPDIERFINDWYTCRIDNVLYRQQNINDLIRIVREDNSGAIRNLAKNPLMLTIIALVHRIDAVLPDERVVLYQKCTETLLNTWHVWKFRDSVGIKRGKVDRNNKRRLESLAYWMQIRFIKMETASRTVVNYDDLVSFLTDYIKSNEKTEDADLIAEDFVEFIKSRAGILIEVGDGLYSFIHLTFQEYLASSHLRTINESAGVSGIWDSIKDNISKPYWHEVIRLLVAQLKSDETKNIIIGNIISTLTEVKYGIDVILLLAGLLVDKIEINDNIIPVITKLIVQSFLVDVDANSFNVLLDSVDKWINNNENSIQILTQVLNDIENASLTEKERIRLALLRMRLSRYHKISLSSLPVYVSDFRSRYIYNLFFQNDKFDHFEKIQGSLNEIFNVQKLLMHSFPQRNMSNVVLELFAHSLPTELSAAKLFEFQLCAFANPDDSFIDYNANIFYYNSTGDKDIQAWLDNKYTIEEGYDISVVNLQNLNVCRRIKRSIFRGQNVVKTLARQLIVSGSSEIVRRTVFLNPSFDLEVRRDIDKHVLVIGNGFLAEAICDIFKLHPRYFWYEALLSAIGRNIIKKYEYWQPSFWEYIGNEIELENCSDAVYYFAAILLLIDTWLYMTGFYDFCNQSKFDKIVLLTKDAEFPALKIAHCIRNVMRQDVGVSKLKDLVYDGTAECRMIFERAGWIINKNSRSSEFDLPIYF